MDASKLNPQFDDLNKPETFINHFDDLTRVSAMLHGEILDELIDQFEKLDFAALANPQKSEKFKLTNKHFLVLSIEKILKNAKSNRWGLCRNHDFIYLFNGNYWDELDRESFQKFLGHAAEKMGVPSFTARYYLFIDHLFKQFLASAYLPSPENNKDTVLINLLNGTFEITEGKTLLRPFNASDFITYQLPFSYDPLARAPLFQKYLERVLPDKDCQKVLAEYLGYVFIKHGSKMLKEEKALILYGTGANGKSVFFEVVSALLGDQNTSNYSLESLTNNNGYYRAKLANKLVNYGSEINSKLESATFKQLVSGEPVEARLPYGNPFTLRDYAKLIFNCNELPKDVEQTNAYFRRFLIVPFEVTIPPSEQDKKLHTKIIDKELSGVFNWVIDGLQRLLDQEHFTHSKAIDEALIKYRNESDSVKLFLDENVYTKHATVYEPINALYSNYREYCNESGCKPVGKVNFRKRLEGHGFLINRINSGNVIYISKNPC